MALDIKKKIELFLKSSLHLNLLNDKSNLINIRSDNLYIFNVNITSKPVKLLSSNFIQQQKKGIIIRKLKANIISLKKTKEDIKSKYNIDDNNLLSLNKLSVPHPKSVKKVEGISIQDTEFYTQGCKTKLIPLFRGAKQEKKYLIVLNADLVKIKKILINTGILNKKARPVAMRKLLSLDSFYIISTYINIARLIWTSFSCCDNIDKIKRIIDYHIR